MVLAHADAPSETRLMSDIVEAEHGYADIHGVRLHYLTAGKGPPVVLLHGCPETSYAWRHVIPRLAPHASLVVPDLRGLGFSSRPTSGYEKHVIAADVAALMKMLGHGRYAVVGHDMGAVVAYALAATERATVSGLTAIDVMLPGAGFEEAMLDFTKGQGLWHYPFSMARDIPEMLVAGKERAYLSHFYAGASANPDAISPADIDEYLRSYAAPGGMRAYFEYYRATPADIQFTRESSAQKLDIPVHVIGGAARRYDQKLWNGLS
jgi:pimeloyl-ACP methyl ester carboxylesterase